MKIRLLSDLHAEGGIDKELFHSRGEDVLVLAGDINTGAEATWTIIKQFYNNQPNIVFVFGNHEFYRYNYQETVNKLEDWTKYTGIKVLNPGTVYFDPKLKKLLSYSELMELTKSTNPGDGTEVPDSCDLVTFIGGTLWTNFRNNELSKFHAQRGINDFNRITYEDEYYNSQARFTPNIAAKLFEQHYEYIKHQYELIKTKKVIVTHFLPATQCIDSKYLGAAEATLNDYFANDLGSYIETLNNTTWLHGHTHDNVDITLGTTRVIANPYGYGKNYSYTECLLEI